MTQEKCAISGKQTCVFCRSHIALDTPAGLCSHENMLPFFIGNFVEKQREDEGGMTQEILTVELALPPLTYPHKKTKNIYNSNEKAFITWR